jgi:hypothetical protein
VNGTLSAIDTSVTGYKLDKIIPVQNKIMIYVHIALNHPINKKRQVGVVHSF